MIVKVCVHPSNSMLYDILRCVFLPFRWNATANFASLEAPIVTTNCAEIRAGTNARPELVDRGESCIGTVQEERAGIVLCFQGLLQKQERLHHARFAGAVAPARSVRGRTSIVCSSEIDLKPATESVVIVGGLRGDSWEFPFDFDITVNASRSTIRSLSREHYRKNRRDSEVIRRPRAGRLRDRIFERGRSDHQYWNGHEGTTPWNAPDDGHAGLTGERY